MKRLLILATLALASCRSHALPMPLDGDIIFQTSRSSQSVAIQRATGSRYSHMGLILVRGGKPFVFEAAATARFTPLEQWIDRGEGQHYVIKRIKNASSVLTPASVQRLRQAASGFEGRAYDLTFEWSDRRMYCSELVWKLFDRVLGIHVGELQRLREFNLADPVVVAKMRERYGEHVPMDEPVISPISTFNSAALVTVDEE